MFVSDGAKCDIGRLQMMFGPGVVSAVQVSSGRKGKAGRAGLGRMACVHER